MIKWKFWRKWNKRPAPLTPQQVDFDEIIESIKVLSPRAQTTLMYRIIEVLPDKVVNTTRLYTLKKLNNDAHHDLRSDKYLNRRDKKTSTLSNT